VVTSLWPVQRCAGMSQARVGTAALGCPSRARLGPRHRPTQLHLTRRPRVTFAAPPWITSLPPAKGYNPDSESLPNRAHQERHEVHVHTLQPQREHARFRRQGRQPPHSGRDRNQHSRHQRTPRAHDRFPRRRSAAQLALSETQENSDSGRFWEGHELAAQEDSDFSTNGKGTSLLVPQTSENVSAL
jgi:hypothetical protein